MDDIKLKIRNFLAETKPVNEIKDEDDLFEKGFVDSLFALQLIMFIEKEFKLRIKNKDINEDNFRSIDNIAATVTRLLKK